MPVGDRVRLQRLLRKRGSSSAEDDEQDPPLGRKKTICSVQGVRHVCYTRHTQAVLCWMSAICFGCYAVFGQCVPQSRSPSPRTLSQLAPALARVAAAVVAVC